jgi:sarcosine oxidase subunit alpha
VADTLEIVVDDRLLRVPAGVTVAVALLGADVRCFRRSVSGEPRAPVCGMGICHECHVTVNGVPHRRSCLIVVTEGMVVRTAGDA